MIYNKNGIQIYNDDNKNVLPLLSDIDLFITSPPYNLGVSSGGGIPTGNKTGAWAAKKGLFDGYSDYNDAMPPEKYIEWQKSVLNMMWDSLSDTGAIFYNHKPRVQNGILQTPLMFNPGLPVRQIIIWSRGGGHNYSPSFYVPTQEWIVIFAKPDFRLKSKSDSRLGDVWNIPPEKNNPHPAPFPLEIPYRIIETTNAKNICDPFMGSGTTLKAAQDCGIKGVGIELSKQYCDMAISRLGEFPSPTKLQPSLFA